MMNRPAVAAAVCFLAGTAAAAWGIGLAAVIFALLGSVCFLCLVPHSRRRLIRWTMLGLVMVAGSGYYHVREQGNGTGVIPPGGQWNPQTDTALVELAGSLDSPVEVDGDRAIFYMKVDQWRWEEQGETAPGLKERIYVTVRLEAQEEQQLAGAWKRGDRLVLRGTAKTPEAARNFGGFDFREYLRKGDVHWLVTVKGAVNVQASPPGRFSAVTLLRWNDQIRAKAGQRLERLFPGEEAGYMKGLLIGIREDLDPERYREFSRLGLTHILAISGLHVGVFVWSVTAVCRRLGMTRENIIRIALWTIPLYVVFTGSSPSVVRSGITAMAGLYAAGRGWLKDGLSLLSLALLGMLLWNPQYVGDVGFQLSFLVTAGLLAGVPSIGKLLPIRNLFLNGNVTVALTAQLASFPLSIYYFNQFSVLSLPANLLLVPVISFVITPLGYVALLADLVVPQAGELLAYVLSHLNQLTFRCVETAKLFPAAQMIWPSPKPWWIAVYYGLICLLIRFARRRKQISALEQAGMLLSVDGPLLKRRYGRIAIAMGAGLLLLFIYGYSPGSLTERGRGIVAFLDVGQGDSAWVRTPEGKQLLIDGGGSFTFRKEGEEWKERLEPFEVGRKTVVPLLKKRGVHKLDYIIISHEDQDHIGGLQAVLEEIPVGAILFNGTLKPGAATEQLFQTALKLDIPLIPVKEGQLWPIDRYTELAVLTPSAEGEDVLRVEEQQNKVSVAFLLTMSDYRFLFTGDMGAGQETDLLERMEKNSLLSPQQLARGTGVDVLKVAHHGSRNSTTMEWLDYWQPALAVISAGKNNIYGHPHPLVLERLQDAGAAVFRTDRQGEVQLSVTRSGLRIRTKLEGHLGE